MDAAEALMAFQRGDDSQEAEVGALLIAGGLRDLRDLGALARGLAKKGGG
jgi:hypothetical protein